VQEGCDKFCSFCVVPYTRGAEFSRPMAQVVAEARGLVARGAREIVLLGQNVNAYHGAEGGLAELLHAVAAIPGVARLRYTTSHPRDMGDALIDAHRDLPTLLPLLHLPVQSGSDRMLAAMNRGHKADDFRRVVDRLRAARPDIAFSSDFIAGHPGETDADHAATLALIRDVGFSQSFSFMYSPRPGTPAAGAALQVPEEVKDSRLREIQDLLRDQAEAFNISREGMVMDVLVTGPAKRPGQMAGRSPWLQPVHFDGPATLVGQVARVRVIAGRKNSLAAELLRGEAAATWHGSEPPEERLLADVAAEHCGREIAAEGLGGEVVAQNIGGEVRPFTLAQENQAA
jgi:tRNA-2-methylthio-N6-dimethylallyladenosine synthase